MTFSVPTLLESLHKGIEARLTIARAAIGHSGSKGDASEAIWLDLLETYLPKRYSVTRGHVCDSQNGFSEQMDVIVYDRQYSPLIFGFEGQKVIPAESVYAVFEAKQVIDAELLEYARKKVASVRKLHRTSLPVPHVSGTADAKKPQRIIGGFLSLDSGWSPPLGDTLAKHLKGHDDEHRLDMGCVAIHGNFLCDGVDISVAPTDKAATAFLFELTARLQQLATVPMVDVRAYAAWLDKI